MPFSIFCFSRATRLGRGGQRARLYFDDPSANPDVVNSFLLFEKKKN